MLADEWSQIRSDPVPGLSVDKLGAFQVEIAVPRSELRIGVRSVGLRYLQSQLLKVCREASWPDVTGGVLDFPL